MRKTIILLCFVLSLATSSLFAQQGTVAAGGQATGAGGSVSCSIGQVAYVSATGTGGNVNQGLQQPYEIVDAIGLDANVLDLSISLYPNPTTDFITLKVNKVENLSYQIFDSEGKIISTKGITENETSISFTEYANAIYLVKIFDNQNKSKTFKIFKNY